MTTIQERHQADQDDADRYARHRDNEPPPGEGWVPSGTCGGRWSRVRVGLFETWQPQPVPGVTIAGGGAIYTTTPTDALLAVANSEIAALTAENKRLRAVVRDREDTIIERDITIAQLLEVVADAVEATA